MVNQNQNQNGYLTRGSDGNACSVSAKSNASPRQPHHFWILSWFTEFNVIHLGKILSKFSPNGDVFCRYYRIMRKQKIQQQNVTPIGNWTQVHLTFMCCMLLAELIPLFAGRLRPSDPYIVIIYWFKKKKLKSQRVNKAWLCKNLRGRDF